MDADWKVLPRSYQIETGRLSNMVTPGRDKGRCCIDNYQEIIRRFRLWMVIHDGNYGGRHKALEIRLRGLHVESFNERKPAR